MSDIDKYAAKSGRIIAEDGSVQNIVDLLGGGTPVSTRTYDINRYAAQSGRVIGEDGKVYNLVALLQSIVAGEGNVPDGSITTDKIANGAVTDDKLANPKVDVPNPLIPKMVIGTTLETNVLGIVGYSQDATPDSLAMRKFGGQVAVADPVDNGDAASKGYVDGHVAAKLTSIEPIADPANATIEDVANAFNALLSALKG